MQIVIMYKIKPKEFYILSCEKGRELRPRPFSQLKIKNTRVLTD